MISGRSCSSRRTASGITKRLHTQDEIDAFAAYCPELDESFFLLLVQFLHLRAMPLRVALAGTTKNAA